MTIALRSVQRLSRINIVRGLYRSPNQILRCDYPSWSELRASSVITNCFSTTSLSHYAVKAIQDENIASNNTSTEKSVVEKIKRLPLHCPGCGAPSQIITPGDAGNYTLTRAGVKNYLNADHGEEDTVFSRTLEFLDSSTLSQLGLPSTPPPPPSRSSSTPICDRCHKLIHNHTGVPIYHPSLQSIQDIIEESPHKHNHIYHVLDAADFPMSLIPSLQENLHLSRLRTQNRRSKTQRFSKGRVAEVSFVITRSDLLAPKKEQVDSLLPYLREVLRDALGRSARNVRLGNLRCVSAKRGWWTSEVKEEIWKRGGAGWMVGKVNVGKSNLFEVVFPRNRGQATAREKLAIGTKDQAAVPDLYKTNVEAHDEVETDPSESRPDLEGLIQSLFADKPAENEKDTSEQVEGTEAPDEVETDPSESKFDMEKLVESSLADTPAEIEDRGTKPAAAEARKPNYVPLSNDVQSRPEKDTKDTKEKQETENDIDNDDEYLNSDPSSLLPPAQLETAYPNMPLASALPGTTASPIRIPYGSGRGELIDMPGISRSSLAAHVQASSQSELVMRSRPKPEQLSIKPGQSLLLGGGLVRITPTTDTVVLAFAFVPISTHVTSTVKALEIESGERQVGISSIVEESSRSKMKKAGTFALKWDITRKRAGPLTDPTVGKMKAENLPFVVWGADLLIEGVGWVEISAQTSRRPRTRRLESRDERYADRTEETRSELEPPTVEVYTPEGKHVAVRPPMNASLLGARKEVSSSQRKTRPRRSMKGLKQSVQGRERQ